MHPQHQLSLQDCQNPSGWHPFPLVLSAVLLSLLSSSDLLWVPQCHMESQSMELAVLQERGYLLEIRVQLSAEAAFCPLIYLLEIS